jgi:hypothetical protein
LLFIALKWEHILLDHLSIYLSISLVLLGNKGGRKTRGSFVRAPPPVPSSSSSSSLEGHTKASLFAEKRKKKCTQHTQQREPKSTPALLLT